MSATTSSTSISNSNSTSTSSNPTTERSRIIPNPLFKNLENSRRFRALPIYSSLLNYGLVGISNMINKNIEFCRSIEIFLRSTTLTELGYEVLTPLNSSSLSNSNSNSNVSSSSSSSFKTLNILLFTSSSFAPIKFQGNEGINKLREKINESQEIYVTGTTWRGRKGIRLAVSNWSTEIERDGNIVKKVLERVMRE